MARQPYPGWKYPREIALQKGRLTRPYINAARQLETSIDKRLRDIQFGNCLFGLNGCLVRQWSVPPHKRDYGLQGFTDVTKTALRANWLRVVKSVGPNDSVID